MKIYEFFDEDYNKTVGMAEAIEELAGKLVKCLNKAEEREGNQGGDMNFRRSPRMRGGRGVDKVATTCLVCEVALVATLRYLLTCVVMSFVQRMKTGCIMNGTTGRFRDPQSGAIEGNFYCPLLLLPLLLLNL